MEYLVDHIIQFCVTQVGRATKVVEICFYYCCVLLYLEVAVCILISLY